MRLRLAVWALLAVLVVLATRTVVYALAPRSLLLAALAHNQVGPDVTVPLARLTTSWTAPWVYPLLPVTMAVDTVAVPFLVLNLPMVLVVGD